MPKARYVRVALFEACKTKLQDAKVVGQSDDYLLLETPQPKPRQKSAKKAKKQEGEPVAV